MKLKAKSKLKKKIICISLIVAMATCSLTACSSKSKDNEVVVLKNQQKDIKNVLPIKKMDNVDNFEGEFWLDNGDILGTKGDPWSGSNTDVSNLCIYHPKDKKIETLSDNKDKNTLIGVRDITKDQRYVVYEKIELTEKVNNEDYKRSIYIIDLKNKTEKKIEKTEDSSGFIDENKVIVSKGMNVYISDVDGIKTEIKLPKELIKDMNDFSKLSFERFMKWHFRNNEVIDEKTKEDMKKRYEYEKKNNKIYVTNKKGDEIYLETYTRVPFVYNLKNNAYKQITEEEAKRFYYIQKEYNDDVVKLEKNNVGVEELWELDSNKKHKNLIAKGKLSRNITVSPDRKKVVYCSYGEKEGKRERNTFVYDLESKKSIRIFRKITSPAVWDKYSKQFFIPGTKEPNKENHYHETNIVTLY